MPLTTRLSTAYNALMLENSPNQPRYETDEHAEKRFRGWRLLGIIATVVVIIALTSALVDWAVIGPLEGRAY